MSSIVAILNSRQPMRPCGLDAWVRQTALAVKWVNEQGYTLATSVGLPTWELVLALASQHAIPVHIYLPTTGKEDLFHWRLETSNEFHLHPSRVTYKTLPFLTEKISKEDAMQLRDRTIVEFADVLLPVSIKPNGHTTALLNQIESPHQTINRKFEVPYQKRTDTLAYKIDSKQINPELNQLQRQYLIHWTRTSNGPWPDETAFEYYTSLACSDKYPRSAFDTLRHILQKLHIVATDKHMPHRIPTVSFSSLSPVDCIPLMRWRARYRQMSFEPYGIGIVKETAIALGIQPVTYFNEAKELSALKVALWLTHSRGKKGDWQAEKEYRYRGDFEFSATSRNDLIVLTLTSEEAHLIESEFGVRTLSFQ